MVKQEKLLPCPNPKCGAVAEVMMHGRAGDPRQGRWRLCSACGMRGPMGHSESEADCLWNALPRPQAGAVGVVDEAIIALDDARKFIAWLKPFQDGGRGDECRFKLDTIEQILRDLRRRALPSPAPDEEVERLWEATKAVVEQFDRYGLVPSPAFRLVVEELSRAYHCAALDRKDGEG